MKKSCLFISLLFSLSSALNAQFLIGATNPRCLRECDGEAQITTQTTVPYHYKWNTGSTINYITNLCGGTYSCTVSDSLGVAIDTFYIAISEPIADDYIITPSNVSCPGGDNGSVNVLPSGPNIQPYLFTIGKDSSDFVFSNSGLFTNLDSGSYIIIAMDGNGCRDTINTHISQSDTPCTTQINNLTESFNYTLWPNPVNNLLNCILNIVSPNTTLQITSADGRTVTQPIPIQQNHFEIDVSNLAAGIYFLTLQNGNEKVVRKFVKSSL